MKKIVLLFCLLILHKTIMIGQNKPHPPISPEAAFTQQFGQNEIQVQYARPSSRGRKVFGSLVPYDTIWRTGAGDCTTFFVNGPIEIAGQNLDSGKYSLFTIPGENTWTIILNKDNTMHGTSQYNQEHDVMRFRVIPGKSNNYYETFTIDINEFTASGSAKLILSWENTQVKISLNNPAYNKTDTGRIDTSTPGKRMTEHVEAIKETEAEKNSKNNSESKTSEKTASNIKTQFAPLLNEYYALKDALVQDNSKISAEKAKGLKNKTLEIVTTSWTNEQKSLFNNLKSKIIADASYISSNSKNIEQQRQTLISLSDSMNKMVKELKLNADTAYLLFCPMANHGKGAYWLSKETKILNPYFGSQMLPCGSVKLAYK